MNQSFKRASIWSVIWRSILFSIPLEILYAILVIFSVGTDSISTTILDILFTTGSYAIVYFVIKAQIRNQGFSLDAVNGKRDVDKGTLVQLAGLTLIIFTSAYTFLYLLLRLVAGSDWFIQFFTDFLFWIMSGEQDLSLTYLFITAVIVAPIVEEFFFRGFVLNKWAEKYGSVKGVFWSSFLFMIVHIPSFFVPQLIVGLFCAIVYMKTKKLIYPILVHAFYNLLVILPAFWESSDGELTAQELLNEVQSIVNPDPETMRLYTILAGIFIIALIATLIVFKMYGKQMNNEQTPYINNLSAADDFLEFENARELTEEEYLAVWGEEEKNSSETERPDDY